MIEHRFTFVFAFLKKFSIMPNTAWTNVIVQNVVDVR